MLFDICHDKGVHYDVVSDWGIHRCRTCGKVWECHLPPWIPGEPYRPPYFTERRGFWASLRKLFS